MNALSELLLRLFARTARPYLRAHGLLQTARPLSRSALVWEPASERVVVLAPHMDDEVIGCGGTLARHVDRGADVTVVFLTDGRRGGRLERSDGRERVDALADLVQTRKAEAHRALEKLGIRSVVFLDGEDGRLASTPELAAKLRAHLLDARPDLVYLPWFLEAHADHRAASPLLGDALQGTGLRVLCHAYEAWTPLFPNCLVRIDETVERKRAALSEYASQLAESDYLHCALGLNAYRSMALSDPTCRFVEAFLALPAGDYLALFESSLRPGAANRLEPMHGGRSAS